MALYVHETVYKLNEINLWNEYLIIRGKLRNKTDEKKIKKHR